MIAVSLAGGRVESKAFERRKRDRVGIGNATAFGLNAHRDQCVKYEHV